MHWHIAILRWLFAPIEPRAAVDDFDEPRLPKNIPGPWADPPRRDPWAAKCRKIRIKRLEHLDPLDK